MLIYLFSGIDRTESFPLNSDVAPMHESRISFGVSFKALMICSSVSEAVMVEEDLLISVFLNKGCWITFEVEGCKKSSASCEEITLE